MAKLIHLIISTLAVLGASAAPSPRDSQVDCTGVKAISPKCTAKIELNHRREIFYVGGQRQASALGNIIVGQLYVEKLTPNCGIIQPKPLVFFHGGGGFTGGTWLNTPDNRRGFASYFLEKGYLVYLVDQSGLGRSSSNDLVTFPLAAGSGPDLVEAGFTAVEDYNAYPQAALHTQWPGTGSSGDPAFEQFAAAIIPATSNRTAMELNMRVAGCELLSLIGPSYLIQHSYGGHWGILLSNDCPKSVAGSINLESSTIPFFFYGYGLGGTVQRPWGLTETEIDYVPAISNASQLVQESVGVETLEHRNCYMQKEPARKLPKIASVPYVMITTEASVHATYDHCIVNYMKQIGGNPDWIKLADLGIKGNGHFMYIEKNNDKIADVVHKWIASKK